VRELFDEYARFIWRTVRHLGVRDSDIEDVCQEVFITIHRRLGDFEGRSSIRTWVYGICMRVASDHRRRAHVRREFPTEKLPPTTAAADQDETYARKQARERLGALLSQLDDDKRAVFTLYEIEELPMKDIARIVGCPLQTAYSRLHAARQRLFDLIEKCQPEGEQVP